MRVRLQWGVAVVSLALLAGCGSTSDESDAGQTKKDSEYQVGMLTQESDAEPVAGGTLTFAAYTEVGSLDPASETVAASSGGVELAAVYDALMRWDSATNTVVPHLAESLESNDDYTTWTLGLREGVEFSDGTPLDAEAVKWSIDRYVANGGGDSMLWTNNVESVGVVDALTVEFQLKRTWVGFDHVLTTGLGMIVAKSSDAGEKFTPIGAGPFVLESWAPAESMELKANPEYWDGAPHLAGIKVVFLVDPSAAYDSLDSGSVDMIFLRDPDLVDKVLEAEGQGYLNLVNAGNAAIINGAEGRPGADPRVRQAMHQAIDPKVVRERAYEGAGVASNALFPDYSFWHTDVDPLPFDQEAAKALLEEAKADGFDGKVTYTGSSELGQTLKGFLEAVGFEVTLEEVRNPADQISKVLVARDYDVAGWGISLREAAPFGRLYAMFHSKGNLTAGMPTSPEMDALIEEFQAAATPEEQREVMGRIQAQWNEQVPALIYNPTPDFVTWSDEVNGVVDTASSIVLLHDAWVS